MLDQPQISESTFGEGAKSLCTVGLCHRVCDLDATPKGCVHLPKLYSLDCLAGVFCELLLYGVLRSSPTKGQEPLQRVRGPDPTVQAAHRGASSERALRAVVGMDRSVAAGGERSAGCSGDHSLGSELGGLRGRGAVEPRWCGWVRGEVCRSGTLGDRRGPQPVELPSLFAQRRGRNVPAPSL